MADFTIPGGKEKGTPIGAASQSTLEWWANTIGGNLRDNKSRNAEYDGRLLAAMNAELAERAKGKKPAEAPKPAPAPQTQSIQKAAPDQLVVGSFGNAKRASEALLSAAQQYHLVTPATVVGRLPEGYELIMSIVQIDTRPIQDGGDVYNITGSAKSPKDDDTVGLDRVSLSRIMKAMGGSWISSRRTDDGKHPHYCAWEVWAEFPDFGLEKKQVPGNVDIDTREDGDIRGAAAEEIRAKAERRKRDYPNDKNDGGDSQLLELRKFLVRHAESKAMNKAIGNYGVKRSYRRHELRDKAFCVARLMFTGYSEDPEARREFRQMIGQQALGSRQVLYSQQNAPALPTAPPTPQLHPAPPLTGGAPRQDYDYDADGDAEQTPLPTANTQQPTGQQQSTQPQNTQQQKSANPPANAGDAYEGDDDRAAEAREAGAY